VVATTIDPELLIPEIVVDSEINFHHIDNKFYKILHQFEPLGPDTLRPVFLARNVIDTGFSRIVKDEHIKFSIKQGNYGSSFSGIGFFMAEKFEMLSNRQPFDMVFTIDENEWNGKTMLQLKVIDIRKAAGY
jgi:single-stranded-DNA-specific exonuclease